MSSPSSSVNKSSKETIQIQEVRNKIYCMIEFNNQDFNPKHQNCFFASSFQGNVMLICLTDDNNYTISHHQVGTVVSTIYYYPKKKYVYFGCFHGHVFRGSVTNSHTIQMHTQKYIDTSIKQQIILMYVRDKKLILWNLNNKVKMLDSESLQFIIEITVQQNITAGISFQNPNSSVSASGCVALEKGYPPIIFDCEVGPKIKQTIQKSVEIYKKQQYKQPQINLIASKYEKVNGDDVLIICGTSSQTNNKVIVYSLQYDNKISYLEPVFIFQCPNEIIHLSVNLGIIMVSMYCSINFFDIEERKKLCQIYKHDINVTTGFLLSKNAQTIKCITNKGFSQKHLEANISDKFLKLKVRERIIGRSN